MALGYRPARKEERTAVGHIYIRTKCPRCNSYRPIEVTMDEFIAYTKVKEIPQRLSPSDREALMTGFCDDCWDEMFKEPPV